MNMHCRFTTFDGCRTGFNKPFKSIFRLPEAGLARGHFSSLPSILIPLFYLTKTIIPYKQDKI